MNDRKKEFYESIRRTNTEDVIEKNRKEKQEKLLTPKQEDYCTLSELIEHILDTITLIPGGINPGDLKKYDIITPETDMIKITTDYLNKFEDNFNNLRREKMDEFMKLPED